MGNRELDGSVAMHEVIVACVDGSPVGASVIGSIVQKVSAHSNASVLMVKSHAAPGAAIT